MSLRAAPALLAATFLSLLLAACGGGGGGGSAPATVDTTLGSAAPLVTTPAASATGIGPVPTAALNVLPVTVDRGVRGKSFNAPFVTVTVCAPGGGACTDIDHVMVDTGSWGLRLFADATPSTATLPQVQTDDGAAAAQCVKFVGGFGWGSVRRADVRLARQRIDSLPVHVLADPAFPSVPSNCSSAGANLASRLDAKGILGVGMMVYDCGATCATSTAPAMYYGCTSAGCAPATIAVASQVVNPVSALPAHNNGVSLVMQQVAQGGVGVVSGALVLGIGTETNNQLGSASVMVPDRAGMLTATLKGRSIPAYIDSGTNALLFPDADLPRCGDFYCPAQPARLDVTLRSGAGVERSSSLTVEAPPGSLGTTAAAASVAAPRDNDALWGLPFFFGRPVFVALKGAQTPAGTGPYWAF